MSKRTQNLLPKDAFTGLSIAFGAVSLGIWGLLGLGWYLGPHHGLRHLLHRSEEAAIAQLPATKQPALQTAATVPVMADPARRPADEGGHPGITWDPPQKPLGALAGATLPHAKSLLMPAAGHAPAAWPVHPGGAEAPDQGLQSAAGPDADQGLESAGGAPDAMQSLPEADPGPKGAAKVAVHTPQAAVATAPKQLPRAAVVTASLPAATFPLAAPVVHPRYAVSYRHGRARWALVAATPAVQGARPDVPALDASAGEPLDLATRFPRAALLAERLKSQAAIEAGGLASAPVLAAAGEGDRQALASNASPANANAQLALSPAAHEELVESQTADREDAKATLSQSRAQASYVAKRVARREALRRQQLARAAARLAAVVQAQKAPHTLEVAAAHGEPAAASDHIQSANGVYGAAQRHDGVAFQTVAVAGGAAPRAEVATAHTEAAGVPRLASTLRIPMAGHLVDGPVHVYRLDSGRAYIDVAGARPTEAKPRLMATLDGVFKRGAVGERPGVAGTRLSFDLPSGAGATARIESGMLVIQSIHGGRLSED